MRRTFVHYEPVIFVPIGRIQFDCDARISMMFKNMPSKESVTVVISLSQSHPQKCPHQSSVQSRAGILYESGPQYRLQILFW